MPFQFDDNLDYDYDNDNDNAEGITSWTCSAYW